MANWVRTGTVWELRPSSTFDRDLTFEPSWILIKVPRKVLLKTGLVCEEPQRLALLVQRTSRERGWSPVVEPYQIYWDEGEVAVRCFHKKISRSYQTIVELDSFPSYAGEHLPKEEVLEADFLLGP